MRRFLRTALAGVPKPSGKKYARQPGEDEDEDDEHDSGSRAGGGWGGRSTGLRDVPLMDPVGAAIAGQSAVHADG